MNYISEVQLVDLAAGNKFDNKWLIVLAYASGCSLGQDSRWLLGDKEGNDTIKQIGWFGSEAFGNVRLLEE